MFHLWTFIPGVLIYKMWNFVCINIKRVWNGLLTIGPDRGVRTEPFPPLPYCGTPFVHRDIPAQVQFSISIAKRLGLVIEIS